MERTWDEFIQMVNLYRALGYRIVEFEPADDGYGVGSWIAAYDTHGVDANELPITAFVNDDWRECLRFFGGYVCPVELVSHLDVTDDPEEMEGYAWMNCNFHVYQLVTD